MYRFSRDEEKEGGWGGIIKACIILALFWIAWTFISYYLAYGPPKW